jgi:hypothetical protein
VGGALIFCFVIFFDSAFCVHFCFYFSFIHLAAILFVSQKSLDSTSISIKPPASSTKLKLDSKLALAVDEPEAPMVDASEFSVVRSPTSK